MPALPPASSVDRYSQFVSLMRWTMPFMAVVILIMLFAWPSQTGTPHTLPASSNSQREIINLRYTGVNAKDDPLTVTAAKATQTGATDSPISLEVIHAALSRATGGLITLTAQTGFYNQQTNHLTLTGQVHIIDAQGYNMTTDLAEIDLNKPAQAWGDKPVSGTGPQGKVNASGFRITDEGKTVLLTGKARLNLPQ